MDRSTMFNQTRISPDFGIHVQKKGWRNRTLLVGPLHVGVIEQSRFGTIHCHAFLEPFPLSKRGPDKRTQPQKMGSWAVSVNVTGEFLLDLDAPESLVWGLVRLSDEPPGRNIKGDQWRYFAGSIHHDRQSAVDAAHDESFVEFAGLTRLQATERYFADFPEDAREFASKVLGDQRQTELL